MQLTGGKWVQLKRGSARSDEVLALDAGKLGGARVCFGYVWGVCGVGGGGGVGGPR